jgi:hypothetical protein
MRLASKLVFCTFFHCFSLRFYGQHVYCRTDQTGCLTLLEIGGEIYHSPEEVVAERLHSVRWPARP